MSHDAKSYNICESSQINEFQDASYELHFFAKWCEIIINHDEMIIIRVIDPPPRNFLFIDAQTRHSDFRNLCR